MAIWRDRKLWLVLTLAALAALVLAARSMERAFPLVSLELRMDRDSALARARALAQRYDWGTESYQQAASFGNRAAELQQYVEQEAGGGDAWLELVERGELRPYLWLVRQFREGEAREALVRFSPDGAPWGFRLTLPESEPGGALEPEAARALAERQAAESWGVDLGDYVFVQSSREIRSGGRADHVFVYERPDTPYGDARFRLRLGVAGDRLSEVTRYVEVPDAFLRRYAEMRATNDLIALVAGLASTLLYLGFGAGLGLILLLRHRQLVWRPALFWAGLVAALVLAASLNALPLGWMDYDTAVPAGEFLAGGVLGAALGALGTLLLLALVLMAGEGLTRRALPGQLQLWRLWSPRVAASPTVLGATLGGYLIAAFHLAYAVGFYLFATTVLGWTVSADVLLSPDLLATPLPWVSAVGLSAMAAFSEEAMFRAIPLAGAALLGRRFGRPAAWLGVALVVQALVFAAAHASYPQQPAYARVIELMFPALVWGLVFLRFGLLPVIVAHFLYDLVWFALPLFATSSPGLFGWLNRTLVLTFGALPLAVALAARLRLGATAAPADALNGAWRPPVPVPVQVTVEAAAAAGEPAASVRTSTSHGVTTPALSDAARGEAGVTRLRHPAWLRPALRFAPLAGAVGLALWVAMLSSGPAVPRLEITAREAEFAARSALADHDEPLAARLSVGDPAWRALRVVSAVPGESHRFVLERAGREAYEALLGSYLATPSWLVRFARFDGPVEERAEEYLVLLGPKGEVQRIVHRLPEARPGARLDEESARRVALGAIGRRLGLGPAGLREVSAQAQHRPARTDWTFSFAAPAPVVLPEGETRVEARLAGDLVADVRPYVFLPESWEREQRGREQREGIILLVSLALVGALLVGVLVAGAVAISRHALPGRFYGWSSAALGLVILVLAANRWPMVHAGFDTARPYGHQVFMAAIGAVLPAAFGGTVLALLLSLGHAWVRRAAFAGTTALSDGVGVGRAAVPVAGASLGAVVAGLEGLVMKWLSELGPIWPNYSPAGHAVPVVAEALLPVVLFVLLGSLLLAVVAAATMARAHLGARARGRGSWANGVVIAAVLVLALGPAGLVAGGSVGAWLGIAAAVAVGVLTLAWLVPRAGAALLPPLAAVPVVLEELGVAVRAPYVGAVQGGLIGAALVVALAVAWVRLLRRADPGWRGAGVGGPPGQAARL